MPREMLVHTLRKRLDCSERRKGMSSLFGSGVGWVAIAILILLFLAFVYFGGYFGYGGLW